MTQQNTTQQAQHWGFCTFEMSDCYFVKLAMSPYISD